MTAKRKSKVSNFLVWIILGLLIVGLAGFGVGSFGGSTSAVASVGQSSIDLATYGRAVQQQMRALEEQAGERVTFAQAQAAGVDRAVLANLLATAALNEATRKAGLSVGDDAVSAEILSIPAFRGLDGAFDREAYAFALEQSGLTVAQFEAQIRQDLARGILERSLIAGVVPSPTYSDTIYRFVGERRSFTYAQMTSADLDAPVAEPDAADIQAYYDENPDTFSLPERKAITYIWLTPGMLLSKVRIDDTALSDGYQERISEFVSPERRMVDRLAFADEAAAAAASQALAANETTFDAILQDRDLTPEDVNLGIVAQGELADAGEGVFALTDTGVTGPLPSPVGPALYRVNAILAAQETSFEDAKELLREELAQDAARRMIDDEIEALDDLLAGGATLEELEQESEAEIAQLEWTGASAEDGIATYVGFQRAAATVADGDYPEVTVLEDGSIFALRMDQLIPSSLPSLEDVRDEVTGLARAMATRDALSASAEGLVTQLDNGVSFEDLALTPSSQSGLTRRDFLEDLPPSIMEQAFALDPGKATIIDGIEDIFLVRLDVVQEPDPNDPTAAFLRNTLGQQAAQAMAQDIVIQVARAVQAEEGISVDQAAINAVHVQMP